jgi:hypothetical protein
VVNERDPSEGTPEGPRDQGGSKELVAKGTDQSGAPDYGQELPLLSFRAAWTDDDGTHVFESASDETSTASDYSRVQGAITYTRSVDAGGNTVTRQESGLTGMSLHYQYRKGVAVNPAGPREADRVTLGAAGLTGPEKQIALTAGDARHPITVVALDRETPTTSGTGADIVIPEPTQKVVVDSMAGLTAPMAPGRYQRPDDYTGHMEVSEIFPPGHDLVRTSQVTTNDGFRVRCGVTPDGTRHVTVARINAHAAAGELNDKPVVQFSVDSVTHAGTVTLPGGDENFSWLVGKGAAGRPAFSLSDKPGPNPPPSGSDDAR